MLGLATKQTDSKEDKINEIKWVMPGEEKKEQGNSII